MKNLMRKLLLITSAVCMLSLAACSKNNTADGASDESVSQENTSQSVVTEASNESTAEEITLNLWYTSSYMQDYFESAISKFTEANPNVNVVLKLCAESGYLENINADSIKRTNVVDIYMLPEEDLEQAYLAGLALEYNPQETVFTEDSFSKTALRAVTYKGKQVAYPLCFDSAFLVYNRAYTNKAPKTFDELLDFANNFEDSASGGVITQLERVLVWNVSDVKMNYQFLSSYFSIGGECGDDREVIDISNDNVIRGLEYYKSLNDFFALDRNTITDQSVVDYFVSGKAAFTITNTAGLTTLHTAGMDFGVCAMPDITSSLSAGALSTTETLVINPYSENVDMAKKLVQALAYDYADDFYIKTGYFPSRFNWEYDSSMVDGVYENYADSTSRPKIMNLGDFYVRLEILMHNVWDGGSVEELLPQFENYVREQLEK